MLILTEVEVARVLTMEMALEAVEATLRHRAEGRAENIARQRARAGGGMLHLLGGADAALGMMGYKAYTTSRAGARFHVGLIDAATGRTLAWMEADGLGQVRTGAATGVATKALARVDSRRVGLFGTGKQARTQAIAVSRVRSLDAVCVYSRDAGRREVFARALTSECQCAVIPVADPRDAVRDMDIVITATSSKTPVFQGEWLADGAHVNAIGSNFLNKAEIDAAAVGRCRVIAVDDKEQARLEAGDFVTALNTGLLTWDQVHELGDVLIGKQQGRVQPREVTLFKSIGIGLEDVAVAARVYAAAKEQGIGREIG